MRRRARSAERTITFESFGVGVELALGEPQLGAIVEAILPPIRRPCDRSQVTGRFTLSLSGDDTYDVMLDDGRQAEHVSLEVALDALDGQLRVFIAANAPELTFVHAGAVAHEGKAIVIPGESFTGKTTLVRALVQAGATYYSDEFAVLDADGRVQPYPRRLSIRAENGAPGFEQHVSELGGVAGGVSAEVGTVLITRYRPDADGRLERRSAGKGVVALMANTVPAQARPQESLCALSRAAEHATILEGDRGEATAFVPRLLDELRPVSMGEP